MATPVALSVELRFTPTYTSRGNQIRVHFGPFREFVLDNSNRRIHVVLAGRPKLIGPESHQRTTPRRARRPTPNEPGSELRINNAGADSVPPHPREPL